MMIAITVIMLIVMVTTKIMIVIKSNNNKENDCNNNTNGSNDNDNHNEEMIRRTRMITKLTIKLKENYKKRTRKYETQKEERNYMLRKAGKK